RDEAEPARDARAPRDLDAGDERDGRVARRRLKPGGGRRRRAMIDGGTGADAERDATTEAPFTAEHRAAARHVERDVASRVPRLWDSQRERERRAPASARDGG